VLPDEAEIILARVRAMVTQTKLPPSIDDLQMLYMDLHYDHKAEEQWA
jgi:hypothetical protein